MEKIELSRRNFLASLAAGAGTALLNGFGCSAPDTSDIPLNDAVQLELHEVSRAMSNRSLSPVELTRACLDRVNRLDSRFNSFITVTAEQAVSDARVAENELTKGNWRGPLHGVPIAVKDLIDTAGILTSVGSQVFTNRIPDEDAEVVRLLKAAGAVIIGKLNLHEFGMGATSAISHFGPVRNPWNVQVIAGGSSGGSAAAVAARFCFGALGTDTGGSIRIPSACCGVIGFKPTYGLVSNQGVFHSQ